MLTNLPYKTPYVNNDILSDINDSDWHTCAYNHYNDMFRISHNRVIYGIILGIDKTHIDVKHKLCLEGVNFFHYRYLIWLQEETIILHDAHYDS